MITAAAFLAFSGFFAGYNSSAKAVHVGHSRIENALRDNTSEAKKVAVGLLLLSLTLSILYSGIAAGTFLFFVFLMVSGSLIVLLSPLKIVTLRSALVVFVLSGIVEILFLL
ncbi:MAG: hypothetical protein EOO50_00720 [Flavobacterium sp.]|uniref:hypothetical protein n=1 Tax=Flavobacterium sp. TaxID=239 RepID=UPI00120AA3AA|nr:hypothetical protein [Flavobacterium sp.]RZJ68734.1 MAG: hypothetical protein EOO50_00720 [Flavobacterium sp.]